MGIRTAPHRTYRIRRLRLMTHIHLCCNRAERYRPKAANERCWHANADTIWWTWRGAGDARRQDGKQHLVGDIAAHVAPRRHDYGTPLPPL